MTANVKNILRKAAYAASISCIIGASALSTTQAENLRFADSFPTKHYLSSEGMAWWMERVEELTDQEITFTHFPAEQLAKAGNILEKVRDGVVDAGYVGIGYVTDRMPLNGAVMLAGLADDPVTGSEAYWDLVQDGPLRKEFDANDVVPLFAVILPPYQMVLNRDPIESVADFKGLKIRSSGTLNLAVDALGATPVAMAAPEIYLGMQRGTLNGSLLPAVSAKPYNLGEVMSSISTNGTFGTFAVTAVMRKDVFDALTEAQQKAVMQAGDDTVAHLSGYMKEQTDDVREEFRAQGITVYEFSPQVLADMDERLVDVQDQWVQRMSERGLDGQAILDAYRTAIERQEAMSQ